MNTFEVFFFPFSWQSLQLKTAEPSHVSLTFLSMVQYAHIRYQRTALLNAFSGRRVCMNVVYFGGSEGSGVESADIRGRNKMKYKQSGFLQ